MARAHCSLNFPDAKINVRRAVELLYHIVGEMILKEEHQDENFRRHIRRAQEELCSVEGVIARWLSGETIKMISEAAKLVHVTSHLSATTDSDMIALQHFFRWLLRDAKDFQSIEEVVVSALWQPRISVVFEMCQNVLKLYRPLVGL